MIAIAVAFSALFGLSAQAVPLTQNTAAVQSQVAQDSAATQVYWRRGYRWYGGYRPYYGYGWRRAYRPYYGYGWRHAYRPYYGYGWRGGYRRHYGYGWRGGYRRHYGYRW
jgi:hypothetical protein